MTREERDKKRETCVARHTDASLDRLVGLLLRAFADSRDRTNDPNTDGAAGRSMRAQMLAARQLLRDIVGDVFDELIPAPVDPKPQPSGNGTAVTPARK